MTKSLARTAAATATAPATTSPVHHIASWVNSLADLCSHPPEQAWTKDKGALYATLLAKVFPVSVFTPEALIHCATKWFPSFEELRGKLGDYARENTPATLAIAGPDGDKLDPVDALWLRFWHQNVDARRAATRALKEANPDIDPLQTPLAMLAGLVRSKSPKAWEIIDRERKAGREEEPAVTPQRAAQVAAAAGAIGSGLRAPNAGERS